MLLVLTFLLIVQLVFGQLVPYGGTSGGCGRKRCAGFGDFGAANVSNSTGTPSNATDAADPWGIRRAPIKSVEQFPIINFTNASEPIFVKFGSCPQNTDSSGSTGQQRCPRQCSSDEDCLDDLKCCPLACGGAACRAPVENTCECELVMNQNAVTCQRRGPMVAAANWNVPNGNGAIDDSPQVIRQAVESLKDRVNILERRVG